jgi:Protein of unknown function (DUF2510)
VVSVPAGWWTDPTACGRLRYWDGAGWTDWVHVDGRTTHAPLGHEDVASPPSTESEPGPGARASRAGGSPATAALAPVSSRWRASYPRSWVARIGSWLVVCGGVCAAATLDQPVTRQALPAGGAAGYNGTFVALLVGLAMIVAGAAGAELANIWVRLCALMAGATLTTTVGLMAIASRTGSPLISGVPVALKLGWYLLLAATALGAAGTLVMMGWPTGPPGTQARVTVPFALVGLICGLVGLVIAPFAALGCMCGGLGRYDARVAGDRRATRGFARGVQSLGAVVFGLWSIALIVGMLVVSN